MNQDFNFENWIIYQDDFLLAINKPSGLLSVPGRKPEHKFCVISQLHKKFPSALIVHRLDMDTSGLMLIALDKKTHRELSILFQDRKIDKTYLAFCQGIVLQKSGIIQLPMRSDWDNRPKQIIDFEHGRYAQTEWHTLKQHSNYFSVRLHPVTGRSHQLRLHMKSLGHPILGDNLYADELTNKLHSRLMLHASKLTFTHPVTEQTMTIECPSTFSLD